MINVEKTKCVEISVSRVWGTDKIISPGEKWAHANKYIALPSWIFLSSIQHPAPAPSLHYVSTLFLALNDSVSSYGVA